MWIDPFAYGSALVTRILRGFWDIRGGWSLRGLKGRDYATCDVPRGALLPF